MSLLLTFAQVMLDVVLLNLQARLLFLSVFQWLQFGFHISTSIVFGYAQHQVDETLKIQP